MPATRPRAAPARIRAVALAKASGLPVVISAGDDTTARIWDLETGAPLDRLADHKGPVLGIAVAERTEVPIVVTASADKTVVAWPVSAGWQADKPTSLGDDRPDPVTAVACAHVLAGGDGRDRAAAARPRSGI